MGPNDDRHVVWAICKFLFLFFFIFVDTNYCFIIYIDCKLQKTRLGE